MLRRPPGEGRRASQQQRLFIAFAIILLPWLQLVDAQQQHRPVEPALPQLQRPGGRSQQLADDAVHQWAATPVDVTKSARETVKNVKRASVPNQRQRQQQQKIEPVRKNRKREYENDHLIIPDDASALATLAPAQSVGAPNPSRYQRSSSIPEKDWEVEDFVLLATVDGDLYANDRRTGKERWHLEVDHPMVETKHHRSEKSILDENYLQVDHYVWAVEPNRDGGIYLWAPDSNRGFVKTGFTMKKLVEELAPYADESSPVVYTGDKKTTMITLDAATGRVLKWFGATGSHVNEAESCARPDTLYDENNQECSSTGTITLGRTEYTVGIQRREDGLPIATLRYSEWSPNNYDSDLFQQHQSSLDKKYITSQHDGKVYAFDYARSEKAEPLFSEHFAAPVARVFDVCRPGDATSDSNPDLVVLPQPPMPPQDETHARMRSNSIFLNQTRTGDWYVMSGRLYPLIIHAPIAQLSRHDWWNIAPSWDTINQTKLSKVLVGTHFLDTVNNRGGTHTPSLPAGAIEGPEVYDVYDDNDDLENNDSKTTDLTFSDEPAFFTNVKKVPLIAAQSVKDFITNPVVIIIFVSLLYFNNKNIRRHLQRGKRRGFWNELQNILAPRDNLEEKVKESVVPAPESSNLEPGTSPQTPIKEVELSDREATPKPKRKTNTKRSSDTPDTPQPQPQTKATATNESQDGGAPEKKKKAHRGRRGGVKHRKGRAQEASLSRGDDPATATVEDAVNNAKKLGERPSLEPDVMTVHDDMQSVTGSTIRMGNIEVNTDEQLGTGSNGTLVFAGKFDGRADMTSRPKKQGFIRYYSQQIRDGFLYIALERCAASLADVVEKPNYFRDLANAGRHDLPNILYQITNGISHLHELRIVHRDLKPQNILVNMGKDGKPRMLVSDFGLCKKLEGGQSSFGATTGRAAGTSGWRAPELLLDDDAREGAMMEASTQSGSGSVLVDDNMMPRRATRAIDIFSLGLVFFYVLTNGSHPFDCGDRYMREVNIRKGQYNLDLLDSLGDFAYEAKDLIASMLEADPKNRPNAKEIMAHPFFWSPKKRLAFLCDVSDHFEKEPRDPPSPALAELERHAGDVTRSDFLRVLPRDFVDSLGKQRKYTGSRLLDLLRALRNKKNHYEDMPEALKRTVGPLPEGYLAFWTVRFPMLLLTCWNVVWNVQWEKSDRFREYYEPAPL
ncbi:Serine/threonine-protein kinase/endoribonuclease IRE1 [Fusarium oxysporum f. sp. cubense race 1]|uniref:non-specific serine/threonine protein kinase n=1 Tax=Fusarium oxysporum f. sp. cubense (strain race 1) TaxID=1229664 RepID=N4U9K8_FUSC1|nr:Serine/threonine-protein kinase/endoribonuclease IRE1 [Fusarium oxysporum f. sp. cubense race 1]